MKCYRDRAFPSFSPQVIFGQVAFLTEFSSLSKIHDELKVISFPGNSATASFHYLRENETHVPATHLEQFLCSDAEDLFYNE